MYPRSVWRVVVIPGVLAALLVGGWLVYARWSYQPPPAPPPAVAEVKPAAEFPKAEGDFPAFVVGQGRLGFSFQAYDRFSSGRLALARGDGSNVEVVLAEFRGGELVLLDRLVEPVGKLYDLQVGALFNDGVERAVVTAGDGMLVIAEDGKYGKVPGIGIVHTLIGDWDADGRQETGLLKVEGGEVRAEVWRFSNDGKSDVRLTAFDAPDVPAGPSPTFLTNNQRRLFIGVDGEPEGGNLPLALFTLDSTSSLGRFGRYPVHHTEAEPVTSMTGASLADKPSIVVAYQARRSYLELFDISTPGNPSRGKLLLPDGQRYMVMVGGFLSQDRRELLAISPDGRWIVFGF